jgi:preprotein translocase subunit SecE
MARDRQRAKQRKARRAAQNPGPAPSEPHRSNVPGELEHASGDADEFDAALVSGADGEPVDADARDDDVTVHATVDAGHEPGAEPEDTGTGEIYDDEVVGIDEDAEEDEWLEGHDEDLDEPDPELEAEAVAAPARARRAAAPSAGRHTAATPAGGGRSGPGRLIGFLQASWAELQRVQWPDRRQVFQATAVVLGFVVVAGLYLGLADRVAQELVDLII